VNYFTNPAPSGNIFYIRPPALKARKVRIKIIMVIFTHAIKDVLKVSFILYLL